MYYNLPFYNPDIFLGQSVIRHLTFFIEIGFDAICNALIEYISYMIYTLKVLVNDMIGAPLERYKE